MEKQIYNENNGLWYELQGDYYLPCLKLPEQKEVEIGIWGQRRKNFLYENHKVLYTTLLTSCKLCQYLVYIDVQAAEMFETLVSELAEKEGITEKLKAEDPMAWVQRMNNIRNRAMEIVNSELIYT